MIQFYTPDIEKILTLSETESAHCCRVLRLKEGDRIRVTDGEGHLYMCEIIQANPKRTSVRILIKETTSALRNHKVTLAVAPTKNIDRIEWMLEKAVEIGVNRIVLVKCEHSERKNINEERLRKIIASAMNQSLKTELPRFDGIVPLKDFLKEEGESRNKDKKELYMGYCSPELERLSLARKYAPGKDVTLLIGPEGDFSPEEVRTAMENGFIPVTFGEMRLRTETAALYGLQTIHIINELRQKA